MIIQGTKVITIRRERGAVEKRAFALQRQQLLATFQIPKLDCFDSTAAGRESLPVRRKAHRGRARSPPRSVATSCSVVASHSLARLNALAAANNFRSGEIVVPMIILKFKFKFLSLPVARSLIKPAALPSRERHQRSSGEKTWRQDQTSSAAPRQD